MQIWNKAMECMPREEMEALQLGSLKKSLHYVYDRSPLYKKKFDDIGFKPDDLKSLQRFKQTAFNGKR